MDLMEILKALFGGEALTFEQFAEKVNNAADVKLGNLAGGQYVEKDKYDDVSNQLASANANFLEALSRKVCKFFKDHKNVNALNHVLVFFNTGTDFFIRSQLISDNSPILNLTAIPLLVKLGCA